MKVIPLLQVSEYVMNVPVCRHPFVGTEIKRRHNSNRIATAEDAIKPTPNLPPPPLHTECRDYLNSNANVDTDDERHFAKIDNYNLTTII